MQHCTLHVMCLGHQTQPRHHPSDRTLAPGAAPPAAAGPRTPQAARFLQHEAPAPGGGRRAPARRCRDPETQGPASPAARAWRRPPRVPSACAAGRSTLRMQVAMAGCLWQVASTAPRVARDAGLPPGASPGLPSQAGPPKPGARAVERVASNGESKHREREALHAAAGGVEAQLRQAGAQVQGGLQHRVRRAAGGGAERAGVGVCARDVGRVGGLLRQAGCDQRHGAQHLGWVGRGGLGRGGLGRGGAGRGGG